MMAESETPRTDAAKQWIELDGEQVCLVDFMVAEQLEHELAIQSQKIAELERENQRIVDAHKVMMKLADERAESLQSQLVAAQGALVDEKRLAIMYLAQLYGMLETGEYATASESCKRMIQSYAEPADPVIAAAQVDKVKAFDWGNSVPESNPLEYARMILDRDDEDVSPVWKAVCRALVAAAQSGEPK